MTELDVREALADYFREWFSNGDKLPRGELLRDADALLASDVVARMLAEAEQRGREDNLAPLPRRADYRGRPVSPCECCPFAGCPGCGWQGGGNGPEKRATGPRSDSGGSGLVVGPNEGDETL